MERACGLKRGPILLFLCSKRNTDVRWPRAVSPLDCFDLSLFVLRLGVSIEAHWKLRAERSAALCPILYRAWGIVVILGV